MVPSFKEDHISQIPAIKLLVNMGYSYISPDETMQMRGGSNDKVILSGVLKEFLSKQMFEYAGVRHHFNETNIEHAINELQDEALEGGVIKANQRIYELLTLGKSFEQSVDGDRKSFTMNFIDWENFDNNIFHVTEEFEVEREGSNKTYRPDIVLFINGIPIVVIEAKRSDIKDPIDQAISQSIRSQKSDGIQKLYKYSQLVLSIAVNDNKYATTGTPAEYWAYWKEQFVDDHEKERWEIDLVETKNQKLNTETWDKLFNQRYKYVGEYFKEQESQRLAANDQDKTIYSLLKRDRLLELIKRYVVFDKNVKKIARYQQYFAVEKTLKRIKKFEEGRRQGGVIWHTQGSGKSLTMVMLAKSISLDRAVTNPKVVLVTDRIDLDKQIFNTFKNTGSDVVKARSGRDLGKLVESPKSTIITTVINKFEKVSRELNKKNEDKDVFVLVDESHRGQYGEVNKEMRKVFPNACYIGFTGTPLMKSEKNTARKFGGIIDKYTIDQAVNDKAVVPILYEGRLVEQNINKKPIDLYFEKISYDLTDEQKTDLKKKMAKKDHLNQTDQLLNAIAWDITTHFKKNWQGTGFKAQLTVPSKKAAVKIKEFFDDIGMVKTEVIISPPDMREGEDDIYEETNDQVKKFWEKETKKYNSYPDNVITSFKDEDTPEIIIVVDMLLTGFDAPKNTVLYIAKSLREHNLLQAIARVNRVEEGKDYGYIIDYYGILGELDEALVTYSSLSEFDEEDLIGALVNIDNEIVNLERYHDELWNVFADVKNKEDIELMEQFLEDEDIRDEFYEKLSIYVRTLKMALSTMEFEEKVTEIRVQEYRQTAKFFLSLRKSVKQRYAEDIDYKKYEAQVQKLINDHVVSEEVIQINDPVNIFEKDKFQEEVEKIEGDSAAADTILNRIKRSIENIYDEDPAYFKKLSELIQEIINDFKNRRITEAEKLKRAKEILEQAQNNDRSDVPDSIKENKDAIAYFGIITEVLALSNITNDSLNEELSLKIDQIFEKNEVVDWFKKQEVINSIKQDIEDYILDEIYEEYNVKINYKTIDKIMQSIIKTAKARLK